MRTFSAEHLLTLSVILAMITTVVTAARIRPGPWTGSVSQALAILLVANESSWWVWLGLNSTYSITYALPFQLCDVACFVAAAALWTRRPLLVELTYFWGLAGTVNGLVTPDLPSHFPDFLYFQYFIAHGAIVCAALLLVIGLGITPRPLAALRVYALTVVLLVVDAGIDVATGGNYLYLRRTPGCPQPARPVRALALVRAGRVGACAGGLRRSQRALLARAPAEPPAGRLRPGHRAWPVPNWLGPSALSRPGCDSQRFLEVFAQHAVTIPYPSDRVAALVSAPTHPWTVALDRNGGDQLAEVGVRIGSLPIYKHVRLTLGRPPSTAPSDSVMLPVSWEAVGGPPLFPSMEGILHVNPDGEGATRLTLNARYDPPLGSLGALLDRALLRRLAQATIADFVIRLASSLESELARDWGVPGAGEGHHSQLPAGPLEALGAEQQCHRPVVVADVREDPRQPSRRRDPEGQVHQQPPEPEALVVVGDDDRELAGDLLAGEQPAVGDDPLLGTDPGRRH